MPSSYSPRFGFEQPATGELQGLWGGVVNDAITELLDETIDAVSEITLADANTTLTIPNAVSSPNRASTFRFIGTLTAARTVTLPAGDRFVRIINATTGGFALNIQNPSSASPVSVTNGLRADLAFIGTAIRQVNPQLVAPVSISGSSASAILTITQSGAGDALSVSGPSSFSDDVKLGNGSSLDPILTFTGDDDTGLYLAGADEIGFATAGVERFAIGTTDIISGLEIILPGNATDPLGAVPLQQLSGAANVTISDTAPLSPSAGDLWFSSDLLILSVYYNDGNTSQWVQATPTAYGLTEAAGNLLYLLRAGDTMTGALYLPGDPGANLVAAPKQYVDTRILRAGDTMTGALILNANPVVDLGAAPKQYVDDGRWQTILDTVPGASASNVDFSFSADTYRMIRYYVTNVAGSDVGANLSLQLSIGGALKVSGYTSRATINDGAIANYTGATSAFNIANNATTRSASIGVSAYGVVTYPESGRIGASCYGNAVIYNSGGTPIMGTYMAALSDNGTATGGRFLWTAGTFSNVGRIRVEGYVPA